jgi:DNA-directed RNA polymerase specialized sigma24 family protein
MALHSVQFWVFFQIALDLFLVMLILLFIRSYKAGLRREAARDAARQVIALLEPLLREAKSTATTFENQLKEKARLVRSINERLDSRIISLNLLLNRAAAQVSDNKNNESSVQNHVFDQQETILKMYGEKHDPEEIAKRLSIPRGEVDLVIDLKKKFSAGS